MKNLNLHILFISVILLNFSPNLLSAQSATPSPSPSPTPASTPITTINGLGISGHEDRKHRSPVIVAGATLNGENIKILVDAYQRHPDLQLFPMQFDIFFNGRLYSSQLRSIEQPTPIGVDISTTMFPLPLNFSIVAKTLVPQGDYYTSILYATLNADGTTTVAGRIVP